MITLSTIGRFLSVLAIIGLAVVPIARPAMTLPNTNVAMVDDTAMGMPEDMACCPKQAPVPDCGKDCPLMALCVTAPIHFVSQTGLTVPLTFVTVAFPGAHPDLVSIAQAPPRKPPKL